MKFRRILAACAVTGTIATGAALAPAATADAAPVNWGAIAYDFDGNTAWAVDYGSSAAARNAVRARCGSHCGYFTFYNSCGAVAYKHDFFNTRVGRASGYRTRAAAERAARSEAGPGSRVAGYASTTR